MVDDDDLFFNVAGVFSTWAESHETIPGGRDLSSQWVASRVSRTLEDIEEHGVGSEEDVTGVDVEDVEITEVDDGVNTLLKLY